jgi:mono/diheme cytochrome c family protein
LAVANAVLAITVTTQLAAADRDPEPSAEKGHELAQKLCQGCHVIESGADSNTPAGVPTFRSIANRHGQTGERIANILIQPHAPMPDIRLSREEIQNILSYLESLRTDPTVPPLLPPGTRSKPTYPWPS